MTTPIEPELVFTVEMFDAPDNFKKYWDTYFVFYATTLYHGATYKAWGTDAAEAKKKVFDLIVSDKTNGIIRNPGDIIE